MLREGWGAQVRCTTCGGWAPALQGGSGPHEEAAGGMSGGRAVSATGKRNYAQQMWVQCRSMELMILGDFGVEDFTKSGQWSWARGGGGGDWTRSHCVPSRIDLPKTRGGGGGAHMSQNDDCDGPLKQWRRRSAKGDADEERPERRRPGAQFEGRPSLRTRIHPSPARSPPPPPPVYNSMIRITALQHNFVGSELCAVITPKSLTIPSSHALVTHRNH